MLKNLKILVGIHNRVMDCFNEHADNELIKKFRLTKSSYLHILVQNFGIYFAATWDVATY